jgi:shikimate dehydrogenase
MIKTYISLSKFPSKTGQYFYNYFFQKYNLDSVYIPYKSENILESIRNYRSSVCGISISMPFKKEVIQFLDVLDLDVREYRSCNTVKVEDGKLIGFNTDIYGVNNLIPLIGVNDTISILGDGAMASMFARNLKSYFQFSRKLNNWHLRYVDVDVIINCTGIGTVSEESPFDNLPTCKLVIDLSLRPGKLLNQCRNICTKYISGLEFYKFQFIEQFKIYTGLEISEEEFDAARCRFEEI